MTWEHEQRAERVYQYVTTGLAFVVGLLWAML